ncbi:DNA-binding response OmpR family regulator [Ruminococcaceae bacterium R-25]|nr:DNA-binding response OmpR family regulator [Ruminococcaceae bacterium R-25]SUQ22031.1 DNA-binding response regulator, OmpR family, contains REC and winged-helix (wHTH) domain [Oscillospiraceae bacterium]
MANILICDDEKDIVNALKIYLNDPDYVLYEAHNGKEAVDVVRDNEIHLVLMDIMMPVMDGIEAMSQIRGFSNVPIILLTAKSEDADKVLGLNVGADDYITKPFSPLEVCARVKSQLRRFLSLGAGAKKSSVVLTIGGLELDYDARTVTLDGENISLTKKEFDILKLLMENPNRVFSPKEIYREVWHEDPMGADNTVAVHIRHLREKTEIDPADPRYIKVVFGQGYKIQKGK